MSSTAPGGKSKDNRRSNARLAAVQALYQMDVAQTDITAVITEFTDHRLAKEMEGEELKKADIGFFQDLLKGIVDNQRRLDPLIDNHLAKSWRLNRLDSTLRAILRAGAYELTMRKDVPGPVVISEYVDVAHAFFEKDEPKVVNGVLQNMWKKAPNPDPLHSQTAEDAVELPPIPNDKHQNEQQSEESQGEKTIEAGKGKERA